MRNKVIDVGCLLIGIGIVSLGFIKVNSQTLTVAIKPNTVFSIAFEHNGEASGFRLWCDNEIKKNYTSAEITAGRSKSPNADGNYTYILSAPGMVTGMHSCFVSALYGESEEKGDAIQIPIGNLPMKPIDFRVIVR